MKRLLLVVMILFTTDFVWSEPKPYQKALIDEPLSIMDFMIYKNRVRLEEFVQRFIIDPESNFNARRHSWGNDTLYGDPYEYDSFEWETPQDKSKPFSPPLTKSLTSLEFNWTDGTFDVKQQWFWEYNHHLYTPDQKGRIKTTSENIAKICEFQLYAMNTYVIFSASHEGYTTSDFKKKTQNQDAQIQNDTRITVHIGVFGSVGLKDYTYLECTSDKKSLNGEDAKIAYSYIGNWHQLEEVTKKRTLPIK